MTVRLGVLALLLLLGIAAPASAAPVQASIVVDVATGKVLHASNADTPAYPASLTKMMTLYLTFDALEQGRITLKSPVVMTAHGARQPPSRLGLGVGASITVEQAIKALVTKSANDVAAALAATLAGSEEEFARRMTAKARALGMKNTTFRNASGLPNREQRTTARDMATLSIALWRDHPKYYRYFSTSSFTWSGTTFQSHNRLMSRYPGMDGLKTGYISASGFNLAASVERDGRRLVGVVLGGSTAKRRDDRMAALLDQAFAQPAGAAVVARAPAAPDPAQLNTLVSQLVTEPPSGQGDADDTGTLPPRKPGVVPPAAVVAVRPSGNWSIQVGAFRSAVSGEKAAAAALAQLPHLRDSAVPSVATSRSGGRTLYRALIKGLDEESARSGCDALKRARTDCLVLAPAG